ncbi:MAG: hypothetical protein OEZ33_03375 [Gammaproteobacteria bacterium]|nr:hypothetical protein [Gammaproteobacteria bacterium]
MIKFAFNVWEVCGTSLTGTVVGDVNYNATTVEADLEFTLAGTSTDKSQMCGEAAPEASSIYITLRKQNGSWMIYRASDGIDTRGEAINYAASVSIIGPADGTYFYEDPTMTIDGPAVCGDTGWDNTDGTLDPANCTVFDGAKFEWTEVTGASAYIWIVMDANNPRSGIALALPPTTFLDFADQGAFQNGALIAKEFGFETDGNGNPNFEPHPGSELLWQIAALGSNTVNAIEGGRNTDLATDIIAISKLNRAKLYGTYIPLQMEVYADTNVNGVIDVGTDTLLTFNEIFRGYDAGAADQVIVKIISPNDHATAADLDQDVGTPDAIPVMGGYAGGFGWMPLMDNTPTLHTDGTSYVGELVIPLDEGQNWAEVFDMAWVDDCGGGCPPGQARDSRQSSREQFGISTTGGRPAPVSITSITSIDSTGTSLGLGDGTATGSGDLDAWRHHNAKSGATKITIVGVASGVDYATGNMTPLNMQQLNVNLWNDRIGANAFSSVTTDTNGNFTITIKVYNGDNWINIDNCGPSGGMCNSFMSFGVYTDTGATYVPPIKITSVVETGTATELTAKDSRGNGSRYDASLVASNSITVTGTMLNFDPGTKDCTDPANQYPGGGCPWYDVGSEGGWKGGILTVQPSDEFTITANLYNGYNHISMSDTKGNWYGMEIYTSAGKPVVKPTITHYSEDGGTIWIAYTSGDIAVASCDVRIKGTAEHGELRAYWNGSFDNMGMREYFWEEKVKVVNDSHAEDIDATDGMGIFEFTVPVTSGTAAENFIDINDAQWRWTGIRASTTGSCQYTPPVMTVTGLFTVADTGFTTNLATMSDAVNGGTTAPTAETQLVIAGTTGASRDVKVETWSCGRQQFYFGTSDGAGNFAVTIDVYDGYTYYNINDGFNWGSMNIDATGNGNVAVPAMQISVADGAVPGTPLTSMNSSCDWADYDVAMAASVVITGTTEAGDGTGNYDINGVPGTFTITGGSFSFTLDSSNGLYNGYNNLNVFDTNWNGFHVNLNNVNSGATAPQFVTISSHVDGAQVVGTSGGSAVTVSGSVDLTAAAPNTYEVFKVRAMVEDCNAGNTNCTWTYFSSDSNDWQYGDMPITYDDATGNFSFSATIDSDSYTNIEVNAEGDIVDATNNRMWAGHGHRITVNDTGCTSNCGWYWKPTKVDNSVDLGRAARRLQDAARKIGKQ